VKIQPIVLTTPARRHGQVDSIAEAFADHSGFETPLIHSDDRGAGAAAATRDAIRRAGTNDAPVLFLEDDVLVDPEAPDRIARADFPEDVAVISFCDMREVPEFSPGGLYLRDAMGSDGRGWWGNQALLIHAETAVLLGRVDWFAPEIEDSIGVRVHKVTYNDDGRNCSDIRLSLLVRLHGGTRYRYAVSVPSVCKHVGYESVCFPGRSMGERETRNWIADRRRFGLT
jgi:hypothetical protein